MALLYVAEFNGPTLAAPGTPPMTLPAMPWDKSSGFWANAGLPSFVELQILNVGMGPQSLEFDELTTLAVLVTDGGTADTVMGDPQAPLSATTTPLGVPSTYWQPAQL